MSKTNPFTQFFSQSDFTKAFDAYQGIPFDLKTLLETQRKNAQAFSEAHQLAFESIQALAQRQTEILSQLVEDNSTMAKQLMSEGTPEEKMAKNADLLKKLYDRSINNARELSEMINKSNNEASSIINKRVSASIGEIKSAIEKTTQKKAA